MEYKFLKYLNESELNQLESILLGKTSKEDLLKQLKLVRNKTIDETGYDFSVSHIPNYDKKLEDKCTEILKEIKINNLYFFIGSFRNKGNTKYKCTYEIPKSYENNVPIGLIFLIDMATNIYPYYRTMSEMQSTMDLEVVDVIFKDELVQEDFQGPHNMLNYIKNYIYYLLKQEKEITSKDVYRDYLEKRKLVTIQIRDISSYLYEIRNGTNLRLCISNAGLGRNVNKTGDSLTVEQNLYVDALAFGTTLEKLENKDYEDYKKLLYLPKNKELMK